MGEGRGGGGGAPAGTGQCLEQSRPAGTALLNTICGAELSGKGKGGGGGGEDPGALDPRALADGGAKSFGWLAGARRAYGSGAMRVLQPKVPGRKAGEGA